MTLKISVPLHITGFFTPHFSENPLFSGSIGAGLVIVPGLRCVCKFSEKKRNEVFYNGVKTKIIPIEKLLKSVNLNKWVLLKIYSPVPLGFGYGVSGASTLSVSLALHRFLGEPDLDPVEQLRHPDEVGIISRSEPKLSYWVEAAKLAHIAEVKFLTGLGDVIAIFSGRDLAIRIKPGAPGTGIVKSFRQPKNLRIITADLKKRSTKKMLKSMNQKTISLGQKIFEKFIKNPNLENFFEYSQLFAKEIGWADENFFKKLEPIKKYCIGFSVKKGVLFAAAEQNKLKNAVSILKKFSPKIHIFKFGRGISPLSLI